MCQARRSPTVEAMCLRTGHLREADWRDLVAALRESDCQCAVLDDGAQIGRASSQMRLL
jgi:hypothetical protein